MVLQNRAQRRAREHDRGRGLPPRLGPACAPCSSRKRIAWPATWSKGELILRELRQAGVRVIEAEGGLDLTVSDTSLALLGDTTPADLPLQLDVLAAYVIDPGYRPEAMERYRQGLASRYARLDAVPAGALSGPVERLLHGGDPRFGIPPRDQAEARNLDELRRWMEPMLRQGSL